MTDSAVKPQSPAPSLSYGPTIVASLLFGGSVYYSRGEYNEAALVPVVAGLVLLALQYASAIRRLDGPAILVVSASNLAFTACFIGAFFAWMDPQPIIYPHGPITELKRAQLFAVVLTLTYVPFLWGRLKEHPIARHARFAVFAFALLWTSDQVIKTSPKPWIDVWTIQQAGAELLTHGENPYTSIRMQDTRTAQNAVVPYVYPPSQVYFTVPSWLIAKEVRWTMVMSLLLAGVLMRLIVRKSGLNLPSIIEDAPALILWLSPKTPFILEQSWVDPLQLALITCAITAAVYKRPWATAVLLGLVLTSKQTMFWMVGIAAITLGLKPKHWAAVAGVAFATVLPFMIWNFPALQYSNFTFLNMQAPRPEALTLLNWAQRVFQWDISPRVAFPMTALVLLGAWIWFRGSIARTVIGVACAYTVFFMFNKWAFANYYYLLAGLSALAAAASFHPDLGWKPWLPPQLERWLAKRNSAPATKAAT